MCDERDRHESDVGNIILRTSTKNTDIIVGIPATIGAAGGKLNASYQKPIN